MKSYIVATCVDYCYELKEPKLLFSLCFNGRQYKTRGAVSMQESPVSLKISLFPKSSSSPWVNARGIVVPRNQISFIEEVQRKY